MSGASISTARLIEAEQALPDFPQLIKELIDNSIDADASEIKIRIATDLSVSVWDDGHGISDLAKAIQPHTTSKLKHVDQVLEGNINSIGFRGEALAAIVALSEIVELKTFVNSDTCVRFLQTTEGVVSEIAEIPVQSNAQKTFTEISVRRPFYNHHVRLNQTERNRGKQLREILHLIYEYATLHAGRICISITKLSSDQMMIQTLFDSFGCSDVRDVVCRISNIDCEEFDTNNREFSISDSKNGFEARGYLSNPLDSKSYTQKLGYNASQKLEGGHHGRSGGKFVFASINMRPINVPVLVQRRLDSVYRRYTSKNCGGLILFIETKREFDLNMSINKRLVLLPFEKHLAAAVEEEAEKLLKPVTIASVKSETLSLKSEFEDLPSSSIVVPSSRDASRVLRTVEAPTSVRTTPAVIRQLTFSPCNNDEDGLRLQPLSQENVPEVGNTKRRRVSFGSSQQQLLCLTQQTDRTPPPARAEPYVLMKDEDNPPQGSPTSNVESAEVPRDSQETVGEDGRVASIEEGEGEGEQVQVGQTVCVDFARPTDDEVEWRFEAVVSKLGECEVKEDEDLLGRLKVLGSYRKSFIVCHDGMEALYLVDQHAADEKYWFERFNCETQISCQPLLKPITIKLSTERLLILESLVESKVLERNGYKVEKALRGDRSDSGSIRITHMPMIKGLVLNEKDLLQLLQMIDNDNGQFAEGVDDDMHAQIWNFQKVGGLPRPPRVWNIIAMKSCKTAVKFGEKLSFQKMESILSQMRGLKHPWNCPHGRPTIKKLN